MQPEPKSKSPLSGPHDYEVVSRPICNIKSGSCNVFSVYRAMLGDKRTAVPTTEQGSITSGGTTVAYGLGPVKTTVDQANLSITNETTQDHLLHPGTVTREIRQVGDDVVVVTKGTGGGLFPTANDLLAPLVWALPNRHLRNGFKENPPSVDPSEKSKDASKFKIGSFPKSDTIDRFDEPPDSLF